MQDRTLSFETTKRVEYDSTTVQEFKIEPIEDGIHFSAYSYIPPKGNLLLGLGSFTGSLSIPEAMDLINALTQAVEEASRPVSAVYLDRNLQPVSEVHGIGHLQGKMVEVVNDGQHNQQALSYSRTGQ